MQALLAKDLLTLSFSSLESRILQHIMGEIVANYEAKPQDLDEKSASAWYSTHGCERAKMSPEETREWIESLYQYKSANVQHLREWSQRLAAAKSGQSQFSIK